MVKINDLLQKEMTRKEFLATVGFGVATMLGFSSILKMLGKDNPFDQSSNAMGYGGGPYGGHKNS